MDALFERLQLLDPNLPLRIIPLEIRAFSPMEARMKDRHQASLEVQTLAIAAWNANLACRLTRRRGPLPFERAAPARKGSA